MPDSAHARLPITFHGRIIDHFGLEMYQSPVAAIAELVSNSWDADAEDVRISVPGSVVGPSRPLISVSDDGTGMTFEECKSRFLHIGYDTRGGSPTRTTEGRGRPVLGRKGIGKFAGFGIARVVRIETISAKTGEKTVFEMDVETLRGDGTEYVGKALELDVEEYLPPSEERRTDSGTSVILKDLLLEKGINGAAFARSMSRRFLLHQRTEDFKVTVNESPLPEDDDLEGAEFVFPRDYRDGEEPSGIVYRRDGDEPKGWGVETIGDGQTVEWRFVFYKTPIDESELRGVAVFTNNKLAQSPFLFNLVGGQGGQHGIEYLHGRVEAAYLDAQEMDLIAPERQRVNWAHPVAAELEAWGQSRVKSLLRLWKERRNEGKTKLLDEKVGKLGPRLKKLQTHERRTVERALKRVAGISQISEDQFLDIGNSILLSWEQGTLRDLVDQLASSSDMDENRLLSILLESNVVTALHTLEAVEARVEIIEGLARRIENKELENPLRDYIAENPWLISPMWDLFERETSVPNFIAKAREDADLGSLDGFKKRVDLVLSGSGTLLIIEFMRPDKALDLDHIFRFDTYVSLARDHVNASNGGPYHKVMGYLVADKITKKGAVLNRVNEAQQKDLLFMDWQDLLERARRQWRNYFDVLVSRAPDDERFQQIRTRQQASSSATAPAGATAQGV